MDPGATAAPAETSDPELRARAAAFARSFSLIMAGLLAALAAAVADLPLPNALVGPLSRQLTRANQQFERLLAGLDAAPAAPTTRRRPCRPHPRARVPARPTLFQDWLVHLFGAPADGDAWPPQDLLNPPGHAGFRAATLPPVARASRTAAAAAQAARQRPASPRPSAGLHWCCPGWLRHGRPATALPTSFRAHPNRAFRTP